jgi:hypothetical protein
MTALRTDPTLAFPRDVAAVAEIPEAEGGLIRAGRAVGDDLVLAGHRARVHCSGLNGVERAVADGSDLTGPIRFMAPPAANLLATPRSLTLERVGASAALKETILVPERLPGFVIQWVGSAPDPAVSIELPEDARRVHADGPRLRWARAEDDSGGLLVWASAGDRPRFDVDVEGPNPRRVTVRPGSAEGQPVTLLVTAVGADTRLPSLPALAAVAAHRRRDTLEPDDAPGLSVDTGVTEIDEGVAWARAILRGLGTPRRRYEGLPSGVAGVVRGALASGEWDVARTALEAMGSDIDDVEAWALSIAWTADGALLSGARARFDPVLGTASRALRARVADAAEAAGDTEWAEELRRPPPRPPAAGRSLPTVGASPPREPTPDAATVQPAGWDDVRASLSELRAAGPSGNVELAAATLDRLIREALGAEPDAAFGRLAIRPRFPGHWTRFSVDGLPLGDARVGVDWDRDGHRHRFRLRQTAGGAPITWILEPRLPGAGLVSATVDGEPAELDAPRIGDAVQPKIQLPAERERVVELEVSPP